MSKGVTMTINYEKCEQYIRLKLGVHLFPYQKLMLKAFCEEQEVRTARGIGRTFVAELLGQYVASTFDQSKLDVTPDVVFPYTCGVRSGIVDEKIWEGMRQTAEANGTLDKFEREYICTTL